MLQVTHISCPAISRTKVSKWEPIDLSEMTYCPLFLQPCPSELYQHCLRGITRVRAHYAEPIQVPPVVQGLWWLLHAIGDQGKTVRRFLCLEKHKGHPSLMLPSGLGCISAQRGWTWEKRTETQLFWQSSLNLAHLHLNHFNHCFPCALPCCTDQLWPGRSHSTPERPRSGANKSRSVVSSLAFALQVYVLLEEKLVLADRKQDL